MNRLREYTRRDCAYWGGKDDWIVVAIQHRDSDLLDQSNFIVAQKMLGGHCVIERLSHWAVGWIEYLLVDPNNDTAVGIAEGIEKDLENYPVLDDEHYSMLEYEDHIENHVGEYGYYNPDCPLCEMEEKDGSDN